MTLYLAVTPDELELPMFVTESESDMAEWAGVKLNSLRTSVCRNRNKPPFDGKKGGCVNASYRLRKITIEEE